MPDNKPKNSPKENKEGLSHDEFFKALDQVESERGAAVNNSQGQSSTLDVDQHKKYSPSGSVFDNEQRNDITAFNQGKLTKWTNSSIKAASTFLTGLGSFGGYIVSSPLLLNGVDKFINNDISQSFEDINESVHKMESLQNFKSYKEQNGSLTDRLNSASNLSEGLLEGAAFIADNYIGGKAILKGLGYGSKLLKAARAGKAATYGDLAKDVNFLATIDNVIGNKAAQGLVSSVGGRTFESAIEAKGTFERTKQNLLNERELGRNQYNDEQIEEMAKTARNMNFAFNLALGIPDYFQYSKMFRSFKDETKVLNKVKKGENGLYEAIKDQPSFFNKLGKGAGETLKVGGTEALEELAQFSSDKLSEKIATKNHDKDILANTGLLFRSILDEMANDVQNNPEAQMSAVFGGLIGAPMSIKAQASENAYNREQTVRAERLAQQLNDFSQFEKEKTKAIVSIMKADTDSKGKKIKSEARAYYRYADNQQFANYVLAKDEIGEFDEVVNELQTWSKSNDLKDLGLDQKLDDNGNPVTPKQIADNLINEAKSLRLINSQVEDLFPEQSSDVKKLLRTTLISGKYFDKKIDLVGQKLSKLGSSEVNTLVNEGKEITPEVLKFAGDSHSVFKNNNMGSAEAESLAHEYNWLLNERKNIVKLYDDALNPKRRKQILSKSSEENSSNIEDVNNALPKVNENINPVDTTENSSQTVPVVPKTENDIVPNPGPSPFVSSDKAIGSGSDAITPSEISTSKEKENPFLTMTSFNDEDIKGNVSLQTKEEVTNNIPSIAKLTLNPRISAVTQDADGITVKTSLTKNNPFYDIYNTMKKGREILSRPTSDKLKIRFTLNEDWVKKNPETIWNPLNLPVIISVADTKGNFHPVSNVSESEMQDLRETLWNQLVLNPENRNQKGIQGSPNEVITEITSRGYKVHRSRFESTYADLIKHSKEFVYHGKVGEKIPVLAFSDGKIVQLAKGKEIMETTVFLPKGIYGLLKTPTDGIIYEKLDSKLSTEVLLAELKNGGLPFDKLQTNLFTEQPFSVEGFSFDYSFDTPLIVNGKSVLVTTGGVPRLAKDEGNTESPERMKAWLQKVLPSVPVEIVDEIHTIKSHGGQRAWGLFKDGMIYLSREAGRGTAYHEAFHAVIRLMLKEEEITKLFTEAKEKYPELKYKTDLQIEEALADKFSEYVITKEKNKPEGSFIQRVFAKIFNWIKGLISRSEIETIFNRISVGAYSDPNLKRPVNRFSNYITQPMYKVVDGLNARQQKKRLMNIHYLFNQIIIERERFDHPNSNKSASDIYESLSLGELESIYNDGVLGKLKEMETTLSGEPLSQLRSVIDNFPEFIQLHRRFLKTLGYEIQNVEELSDLDMEDILANPDKYDRIYSKDGLEESFKKNVTREMKQYLHELYQYGKDIEGKIVPLIDDMGLPVFANYHESFAILAQNLSGLGSLDKMVKVLKDLAAFRPEFNKILKDLTSDNSRLDKAKFFSTFSKNNYKFITMLQRGDGTHVIYTNRYDLKEALVEEWKNNFKSISSALSANTVVKFKDLDKQFVKLFRAAERAQTKEELETIISPLSEILSNVGVGVSPDAIKLAVRKSKDVKSFVNFYLNGSGSLKYFFQNLGMGEDVFGIKGGTGELNSIRKIAEVQSQIDADKTTGSFVNEEGKSIYAINSNSYLTHLINGVRNAENETEMNKILEVFQGDKFYEGSKLIELFKSYAKEGIHKSDRIENAVISTYRDNKGEATPYDKMSEKHLNQSDIDGFINDNKNSFWLSMPTPGDKANKQFFRLPKEKHFAAGELPDIKKIGQNFMNSQKKLIGAEFERIKREWAKIENGTEPIKNYHTGNQNALKFHSLGEFSKDLNELLSKKGKDFTTNSKEVEDVIRNYFNNRFVHLKNVVSDNQLRITDKALKAYKNTGDDSKLSQLRNQYQNTLPTDPKNESLAKEIQLLEDKAKNVLLADYLYHTLVYGAELGKLMSGDLAYYKFDKNDGDTLTDYFKRMSQNTTPGLDGMFDKPQFKIMVVQTNEVKDNRVKKSVENGLKELGIDTSFLSAYDSVDETDAFALCSLHRYRDIMNAIGEWSPKYEEVYDKIVQGKEVSAEEAQIYYRPIKGFYYGQHNFDGDRVVPIQLKYAYVPLLPSMTKNNPVLNHIYSNIFEKQGIDGREPFVDELVFDSAVKVGLHNVNNFTEENFELFNSSTIKTITLDNKNWRQPLSVPVKEKDVIKFGTQIRKLIDANISDDSDYVFEFLGETYGKGHPKSIREFKNLYQEIISTNIKEGYEGIEKRLKLNSDNKEEINKSIAEVLKSELERREVPDFFLDIFDINEKGDFVIPIDFPAYRRKFENILFGMFRNNVTSLDTPGTAAVQISRFGIGERKDLKFLRYKKDTSGNVKLNEATAEPIVEPAEVLLSKEYFINALKKQNKSDKEIREILSDIKNVDPELRKIIVYRVPTQGHNSMLPCVIKDFLPDNSGAQIVVPTEITKQMGSDFDVDKLFIEIPHLTIDRSSGKPKKIMYKSGIAPSENSYEQRNNALLDYHWSILTSGRMLERLLQPNTSETLEKLRDEIKNLTQGNVRRDAFYRPYNNTVSIINKAGKELVGIYSLHSVNHAIAQNVGLKIAGEGFIYYVDDKGNTHKLQDLSRVKSLDEKTLISDNISEEQSAAVDNAKLMVLGYLNENMATVDVKALMISLGIPLNYATYFIAQPALRDYSNLVAQLGNERLAQEELLKRYSVKLDLKSFLSSNEPVAFKIEDLKNNLSSVDTIFQQNIIASFLKYKSYARDLNNFNTALTADTKGTRPTFSENYDLLSKLRNIESLSYKGFDNYKSIKAFRDYGIIKPYEQLSKVFAYNTELFDSVVDNIFSSSPLPEDIENVKDEFFFYLMSGLPFLKQIESESSTLLEPKSPTTIGKRLKKLKDWEAKKKKSDPGYEANEFLAALSFEFGKDGIDKIRFNNTSKLSDDEASYLSQRLVDLYEGNFASLSEIAEKGYGGDTNKVRSILRDNVKDLVKYMILVNGFRRTPDSFINIIPPSIWVDLGFGDYWNDLRKQGVFDSVDKELIQGFITQYAINNPDAKFIRTLDGASVKGLNNGTVSLPDSKGTRPQLYSVLSPTTFEPTHVLVYKSHVGSNAEYNVYPVRKYKTYAAKIDLNSNSNSYSEFKGESNSAIDPIKKEDKGLSLDSEVVEPGITIDFIDEKVRLLQDSFSKMGYTVNVELDGDLKTKGQVSIKPDLKHAIVKLGRSSTSETLLHEFSHIYTSILGENHPLVKEGIKQAKKQFPEIWTEVTNKYSDLSLENQGEELLVRVMAKEGLNVIGSTKPSPLRYWFNKVFRAIGDLLGINKNYARQLFEDMMNSKVTDVSPILIRKDSLKYEKNIEVAEPKKDKRFEKLSKVLEQSKKTLESRINYYKRISGNSNIKNGGISRVQKLIDSLKEKDELEQFVKVLEFADKDLDLILKRFEEFGDNKSGADYSNFLRYVRKYIKSYSILSRPREVIKENTEIKALVEEINDKISDLESKTEEGIFSHILFTVKEFSTNPELIAEDAVRNLVDRVRDISNLQYQFGATATSRDSLIAICDKIFKKRKRMVFEFSDSFKKELDRVRENLVKSLGKEDYSWMLQKDSQGNLTGRVVDKTDYSYYKKRREILDLLYNDKGEKLEYIEKPSTPEEFRHNIDLAKRKDKVSKFFDADNGLDHEHTEEFKRIRLNFEQPIISQSKGKESRIVGWTPRAEHILGHTEEGTEKKTIFSEDYINYRNQFYNEPEYKMVAIKSWDKELNSMVLTGQVEKRLIGTVKNEFKVVKDVWNDPKYNAILKDKAKKEFYEFWINKMEEAITKLPNGTFESTQIPTVMKGLQDILVEDPSKMKLFGSLAKDYFKSNTKSKKGFFDENGIMEHQVPVYYTGTVKDQSLLNDLKAKRSTLDPIKNKDRYDILTKRIERIEKQVDNDQVSTNFAVVLQEFTTMAENYKTMTEIEGTMLLVKDVLENREVYQTDAQGNIVYQDSDKTIPAVIEGKNSKSAKRFKDWMEGVFYGDSVMDEGKIQKMADLWMKYTSLRGLGLNIFSGVNNIIIGGIQQNMEAIGGQFFSKDSYRKSTKEIGKFISSDLFKHMTANLSTYFPGQDLKHESKLTAMLDYFEVMQDQTELEGKGSTDKQWLKNILGLNWMFVTLNAGEFFNQSRLGMSMMLDHQLVNKTTGEISNVWNAYELVNNKLQLKKGYEFSFDDRSKLVNKIRGVNQYIHGRYTTEDSSRLQRYWLGRLAFQFRKWLFPAIEQRFRNRYYDERIEDFVEGRYKTIAHFVLEAKKMSWNIKETWNTLDEVQKSNMKKNLAEMVYFISAIALFQIASAIAAGVDDEDETLKKSINFLAYQESRLANELSQFVNPVEFYNNMKNPVPALDVLKEGLQFITAITKFPMNLASGTPEKNYYVRGANKGDLKIAKELRDIIPVLLQLNRWNSLEEKKEFYIK
jgi:hypothetical protein